MSARSTPARAEPINTVLAGVGHLYQGDLDLARVALDRLRHDDLGPHVVVEDLSYGAVAAAQRLEELRPDKLIVVGAAERGRAPGTAERRPITGLTLTPDDIQRAIVDAVSGYIAIDLLLEVAYGLGALPEQTVAIEVEPARTDPSETLSPEAERGLARALELVRDELR